MFHGFSQVWSYLNCNHDDICNVKAKPEKDVNQKSIDFLNQKVEVEPLLHLQVVVF